ncbi:hypothetical protein [Streptomyces sp. NPDC048277]|uniref:hypothetical protein n=1 Tax=Streptomyces sp. NPDC048277 TaxID=3155027 RepID=UPI00340C7398
MTRTLAQLDSDLKDTDKDITQLKEKLARTAKSTTNAQTGFSTALTALTGTVTALTLWSAGISLLKIDEKGITFLGATREWPWKKKIDELQKWFESSTQKADRRKKEAREELIDENRTYIENLKNYEERYYQKSHAVHLSDRIETAKRSADRANGEIARLRTQLRSVAAAGTPNTVAANLSAKRDVTDLRSSVTALSQALAGI